MKTSILRRVLSVSVAVALAGSVSNASGAAVLAAGATFSSIDFPGAVDTVAAGINSTGAVVGDFRRSRGGQIQGYSFSQGTFTEIECPGASFTRPTGINDDGNVVGVCTSNDGHVHGFLLSGGAFRLIDVPGAVETLGRGIDNAGDIVGGYCAAKKCDFTSGNMHGFLLRGGVFTSVDFPGAIFTEAWRINDVGQILGRYLAADGLTHLFLLTSGTFTSIPDFPGAIQTAFGITFIGGLNGSGDIISDYCNLAPCPVAVSDFFKLPGSTHGFLLRGGVYSSFDFPGALNTGGFGINDTGEIVGIYFGQDGSEHGFLRTP